MRLLNGGILIGVIFAGTSAWALDRTEIDKKLEEMKSKDPKVAAAALLAVGSLFIDLNFAMTDALSDNRPEVTAALTALSKQSEKKVLERNTKAGQKRPEFNEELAIGACCLYAEAQEIYHRTDYAKTGVLAYAQHLKGDNSLLETKAGTEDLALVDAALGAAEGNPGKATPKVGYCYKILTKQGANAPGGAKDFIVDGKMTLGNALIAYPAEYGKSGTYCFIISNQTFLKKVMYKKDLGAETHAIVEKMTEFDPDKTWSRVDTK